MSDSIDNFYTFLVLFLVTGILYLVIMYFYDSKERFEVPAPAALVMAPAPNPIPRQVSPSGPNPPNARIPESAAVLNDNLNVVANDPFDEMYGSQNIQDNLRYPERSFSPGIVNSGNKIVTNSEIASNKILNTPQPIQPFKPEFIQNGGLLDGIGADDTKTDPNYASF